MADIKATDIKVGRDMQIADRGGTINPKPPPPKKRGNPITRAILALVEIAKAWWLGRA